MKQSLFRILSFIRKEIKSFSKDKIMLFIFFAMPIIVMFSIKFAQNNIIFTNQVGIIDNDASIGYQFIDNFNYSSIEDLQDNWKFNSSSNVYLNITNEEIIFNSSTLLEGESMYFTRRFNTISSTHNEIISSKCDVRIINASLTGFLGNSIGMAIDEETKIIACGISFQYGNIFVLNGSSTELLQTVNNETLYHIKLDIFLNNKTYEVRINNTLKGKFNFAINISTFNIYQSILYPSSSFLNSINVILDDVNLTVDSTPMIDLSYNLSQYFEEEFEIIYYTSEEVANDDLLNRKIDALIIIPFQFEQNITQDFPIRFDLIIDGTNQNNVPKIIEGVNIAISNFRIDNGFVLDSIIPDTEERFVDMVDTGETWMELLIPPLIALSFIGSAMITTSVSIVDDIPLKRLFLSPLKKSEVLVAKFISYWFYSSILQISLFMFIWLVALPVIGWNQIFVGSIFDCFIVMMVLSITGMGFGFLISTLSRTKLQATQMFMAIFVTLLTIWIIKFNELDPISQGEFAIIGVILKGLSLSDISQYILVLLGYAGITMGLSFVFFSLKKTVV